PQSHIQRTANPLRRSYKHTHIKCDSVHYPPLFSFFFTATPTTEIYTLSLHDALSDLGFSILEVIDTAERVTGRKIPRKLGPVTRDRKSTRLNSSHVAISYAVFCLKKKKRKTTMCD